MIIYTDESCVKYVFTIFLDTYSIKTDNNISVSYGKNTPKANIVIFKGEKTEKKLLFDGKKIPDCHLNLKEKIKVTIYLIKIVSYNDLLCLENNTKKIPTKSVGIKKAIYLLKVTIIPPRENTEWR